MWSLIPADLFQLKGGGGERFVHFVDRLIRAEAACAGLAQAEIETQLRVNIKDGGVDTEVRQAIPCSKTGWFEVPTCWQFKAMDAKDIEKNDLQSEIKKPYAKKLIQMGYGYRLCLLGDLAPSELQEWESQLNSEATAINPQTPAPRVIHGGHLLDWAECFPGIIANLRNWPQGVFHWDAWAANCRAVTRHYVPNSDWEDFRRQILEHLKFNQPCVGGNPCLFIGGAAGVGKTRLVFESLAELPQSSSLVVIVEDEQEAIKVGTWLANGDRQYAILVADECSPQTRFILNKFLQGHAHRVRVISIDNTGEHLESGASQLLLTPPDALKNADNILEANFNLVPEARRRRYAQLSRGFIRLAADMCQHDAEVSVGQMGGLLEGVERYARHRLGKNLPFLSGIALFHKLGFRDDVAGELDLLCQLTGYSRQQFIDGVRATRESPGFVVQAGRYWYITPEIVAQVLFNEAWQRFVAPDLESFFKKLPDEMKQQLVDRVATHARKEVRDQVGSFFCGWFARLTARDLAEPPMTSTAAAIVEALPGEFLPQLRAIIEAARPGELQEIPPYASGAPWGPRRTLVWLLQRLVSFPEFFEDCEACLFQLAVEESEPQVGNNATEIWSNLFSVYCSGTAKPFQERLPCLERSLGSPIDREARLGFAGLAKSLQEGKGHILGEPVVAGRLRPEDWQPATVGEERACYRSALALCGPFLLDDLNENRRLAVRVLADSFYFLLERGLLDDLRRMLTPQGFSEEEARRLVQIFDDFLEHEETKVNGQLEERAAAYLKNVREWSNLFRPSDFSGRLREICARSPWDRRLPRTLAKTETRQMTWRFSSCNNLHASLPSWTGWPVRKPCLPSAWDSPLDEPTNPAIAAESFSRMPLLARLPPLLRGYLGGLGYVQRRPAPDFLDLMTKLESAYPDFVVDILRVAGDDFQAFGRIVRLLEAKLVAPRYLVILASGLGRRPLKADEVTQLLSYFTQAAMAGDADSARAGIQFLATFLLFESRQAAPTCLAVDETRTLAWQFGESAWPFLSAQQGREWGEILQKLAAFDPDRAAHLLGQTLLAEDLLLAKEAEGELTTLAKTNPRSVMAGLGTALLDLERGWRLRVHECRELVDQLPPDVVIAWVHHHGLEAARAIARHLRPPYLAEAGVPIVPEVLNTILREYDDDQVFANFLAGSHSGEVWWGNGAERFRQAAETAKKFLTDKNPRIREWAQNEITHRLWLAKREDQEHEERLLPL